MVYTLWEKRRKKIVRLNTVILIKAKLQSINDIALPARASNKLRGDTIRPGAVCICDDTHNIILETNFQGKNYIMMIWFLKEKLKALIMRLDVIKIFFHMR